MGNLYTAEKKRLQGKMEQEQIRKRVIILGVAHDCQDQGHPLNSELALRLKFFGGEF